MKFIKMDYEIEVDVFNPFFGNPEEIKKEVKKILKVIGKGG